MANVTKILNVQSLLRKLEKLERDSHRKYTGAVIVGYEASYAMAVHEDLEMKWQGVPRDPRKRDPGEPGGPIHDHLDPDDWKPRTVNPKGFFWDPPGRGQSQFLIRPARELGRPGGELGTIIVDMAQTGVPIIKALLMAGRRLLDASKRICPVDTGNLRASGYVAEE